MRSQLDPRVRFAIVCSALALAFAILPAERARAQSCVGDCDGNSVVSVSDLVLGVNVALGTRPVTACEALDADGSGTITIAELIAAVSQSLLGPCATPTPTPTPVEDPDFLFLQPSEGEIVAAGDIDVVLQVPAGADLSTLIVLLDGEVVDFPVPTKTPRPTHTPSDSGERTRNPTNTPSLVARILGGASVSTERRGHAVSSASAAGSGSGLTVGTVAATISGVESGNHLLEAEVYIDREKQSIFAITEVRFEAAEATPTPTPVEDPDFRFLDPSQGEIVAAGDVFVRISVPTTARLSTLVVRLDGEDVGFPIPTSTPTLSDPNRTRRATNTPQPTRTPISDPERTRNPTNTPSLLKAMLRSALSATSSGRPQSAPRPAHGGGAGSTALILGYVVPDVSPRLHTLDAEVVLDREGGAVLARTDVSFQALVATPTATPTDTATDTPSPTPTATTAVLSRASKSSAIALSGDESVLVLVNPDDDSVSIFRTADNTLFSKVPTGDGPAAVAIHPDDSTAFVANRRGATVVKIADIKSTQPAIVATAQVGSEPTALALSPAGDRLYVAEWAEGSVSVIDTESMAVVGTIGGLGNPRAVAVTNDGDVDGGDETLIVTEFFGAPNEDASGCPNGTAETCDTGRVGEVRRFATSDLSPLEPIALSPLDSGFVAALPAGTAAVMTSPNQLYAAAIQNGKVYVTSVSASPEPPVRFDLNVYPVVYVADLATGMEDRSNAGTANLAKLADDAVPAGGDEPRLFLQEIVDLDFDGSSTTAYVVSRAADTLQRVNYDPVEGVTIGTDEVAQIDLPGCQNPIGVAVASGLRRAYLNCWVNGRVGIVDLESQALATTVPNLDLPPPGTSADDVRLGGRFFFTGRGRWSEGGEGYSSCGSCHPDGLSDGITWAFAAGPRQTTSLDGSFSHGPGAQKQRVFNWTAIFDETHDFERNTRGVSGGLGAITRSPSGQCGNVAEEEQIAISADGLGQPVKEVQDEPDTCTNDWDKIDAFLRTLAPPRAPRGLDVAAVERGRSLFEGAGACAVCHGGAGWTVSRRYWTPSTANNDALRVTPFEPPTADPFWPPHPTQIGEQPATADETAEVIGPNEVACVLRNVRTFGVPGDVGQTDLVEVKANGQRAQGAGGFNVPSLYGLAVGAPYLHHGQARTLGALLGDPTWIDHLTAANPDFAPSASEIDDLVAFVLSLDAAATESEIPSGFDACPSTFPAFLSTLSGDQEVPPVDSDAFGSAVFFLNADGTTLTYQIDVAGLSAEDISQAELHVAPSGFNGPIVFFLASPPAELPLRGNLSAADLQVNEDVDVTDFASFVSALEAGDAYVNILTAANPDGEIRGQIRVPTAFLASLDGGQEVPPIATEGSAQGTFRLSADEQTLAYEITLDGVDPSEVTQAHLHVAPSGFNGPVVLFLTAGPPQSSTFAGVLTAANLLPAPDAGVSNFARFVEALRAGDVYANVHTNSHLGGEVRGQVRAQIVLPAAADGAQEVPPVASAASGRARFVLGPDRATLRFALEVDELTSDQVEGADLHVAPAGFAGPPVLSLADGGFAPLRIATLDGDELEPNPEAGIETFADLVTALLAGDAYVDVRTDDHPTGEVRGQIAAPILFPALLGGDQVVPPVTTGATGRGQLVLEADQSSLRFALEVQGLPPLDVAETLVNVAPPGENGPGVFFLAEAGFNNPLVGTLTPDDFCVVPCPGVGTFDDFLGDLEAGDAYIDVTTLDEPDGEIRGQALAATTLSTTLNGDQVVPPVSTAATGQARVVLDANGTTLRFAVAISGIGPDETTGATINTGAADENGPAVFVLSDTAFTGPLVGSLTEADFIPASGSVETLDDFVAELLAGRAYVNVTTNAEPDGEIRGQLAVDP